MIPTVDDDEVFELTNIRVREVSLVDRAANQRKFVVTKRDEKKRSGDPITTEDAAKALEKAQENFANTPAAELDRKDAEEAKKAAEDTGVETISTETNVVAETVVVTETTKVAETVSAETAVVAETVVAVKADESFSTPAMDAYAKKMQAAWLGAIDAVRARLDMMSEEAKLPYGYPSSHIYYLKCMLDCMYDIGGAEWDIESAAMSAATAKSDDVAKREGLAKIGKAILATRALREQMSEMRKRLEAPEVVAEVKKDAPVAAVVDPVVAPVAALDPVVAAPAVNIEAPAFDITKDPAFKALQESMTSQTKTIKSLEAIVDTQQKELAKARSTVRSNALTPTLDTPHNEEVKWPLDMAATNKFRR